MSLLDSLVAFYKFEESSTASISSVGDSSYDQLWSYSSFVPCDVQSGPSTGWGTPVQTTGVIGYGLNLNSAWTQARNSEVFAPQSEFTWAGKCYTHLALGGGDPLICCWGYQTSGPLNGVRLTCYSLGVAAVGGGNVTFVWSVVSGTPGSATLYTATSQAVSADAWHTFECWIDVANLEIGIKVDCDTAHTTAFPAEGPTVFDAHCFHFGRAGQSSPYSGLSVDATGLWSRRLTSDESGLICAGTEYPFGDNQMGWLLYFCGIPVNTTVASANYGAPTLFTFSNPVAGTEYYQDQTPIDLANTANGRMWLVRLRRQGGNSQDTSTQAGKFIALEITYDTLQAGTTATPGRSVPPTTANPNPVVNLYRGNPVAGVIGKP